MTRPVDTRAVALSLGRVESRRLLFNPFFVVGLGFCGILLLILSSAGSVEMADRDWNRFLNTVPVMVHPLVGMVAAAVHSAVTRGRRHGSEELFGACPVGESPRTAGHLVSGWVAVAAVALFAAGAAWAAATAHPEVYGPFDADGAGHLVAAVVLAMGGVALGAALGRWAPWTLAPVVALVVIAAVSTRLGQVGAPHWSNTRQLSTWPRWPGHDAVFSAPPVWRHAVWLAALVALVGWLALAHGGLQRRYVGGMIAALVLVSGFVVTRPISSASARRIADLVADPAAHQTCLGGQGVSVCVFSGDERHGRAVLRTVEPVAAAVPAPAPFVLREVFDGKRNMLGPEVARALAGRRIVSGADGTLIVEFLNHVDVLRAARLRVALRAVGLPAFVEYGGQPKVVAGQARGVVALWLSSRGLPPDETVKSISGAGVFDHAPNTPAERGTAWPDPCLVGSPPVVWSEQDLIAARSLAALPAADVQAIVDRSWPRLADPAYGTNAFLADAGLATVGTPETVLPEAVRCSYDGQ